MAENKKETTDAQKHLQITEDLTIRDEEKLEIRSEVFESSGYPRSARTYRLWFQSENHNLEQIYFWIIGQLNTDWGMHRMEKITDILAASTGSSIFGDMQGRLANQQGQLSNLLATMAKMVKDLFSIVRELRQLRERIGYYKDAEKDDRKTAESAEKTLRGIWIDLVEGGSQNPSSVIGLAQQVGYSILPDLFFNAPPIKENEVEKYVDSLDFNKNIRTMLKRKLFQFVRWKNETYKELVAKRNFQIKFLRQHFDSIRMYMQWIKPYLKQVRSLQMQHGTHRSGSQSNQAHMDSAYIINSFQGSVSEIETLVYKENPGLLPYYPCVLVHFFFRTIPSMDYHAKDAWQQKGPIHVGRTEMTLRAYGWTADDITNYKRLRMKEDWDSLMSIDQSLMDAMELLGEDLAEFLKEAQLELPQGFAQDKTEKKKQDAPPKDTSLHDMTFGLVKGLGELLSFVQMPSLDFGSSKKALEKQKLKSSRSDAEKAAQFIAWQTYKNYKKAHGMITW